MRLHSCGYSSFISHAVTGNTYTVMRQEESCNKKRVLTLYISSYTLLGSLQKYSLIQINFMLILYQYPFIRQCMLVLFLSTNVAQCAYEVQNQWWFNISFWNTEICNCLSDRNLKTYLKDRIFTHPSEQFSFLMTSHILKENGSSYLTSWKINVCLHACMLEIWLRWS